MRRVLGLGAAVLCLVAIRPSAVAQEKPIVAVFEVEDRGPGISSSERQNLTSYLSARLAECGYQVIPLDQIRARLQAQKLASYRSCHDQNCQIELGRELAAQKSLSTQHLKVGAACQLTATLFDLKKAAAELAATAPAPCRGGELLPAVDDLARKLCAPFASGERARTDFDRVLREASGLKERKDRIESTWSSVQRICADDAIPRAVRIELLRKFLDEYRDDNPHREQAQQALFLIQPGTLSLKTEPAGAQVLIDSTPVGRAPLVAELPAGPHKLDLALDGYAFTPQQVEISPGAETRLALELRDVRPARVLIETTPPGGRLSLRGPDPSCPLDVAAPLSRSLAPGEYLLEATLDGYQPDSRTLTLVRGEETRLVVNLKKLPPGTLSVLTMPPGAAVSLDGHPAGNSPLSLDLDPGPHQVVARMDGCLDSSGSVLIESARSAELSLSLHPDLPRHPLNRWGHVTLWSGLGLGAAGGLAAFLVTSARTDYRQGVWSAESSINGWTAAMLTGLGTGLCLLATSAVLFYMSPSESEREQDWLQERLTPNPDTASRATILSLDRSR